MGEPWVNLGSVVVDSPSSWSAKLTGEKPVLNGVFLTESTHLREKGLCFVFYSRKKKLNFLRGLNGGFWGLGNQTDGGKTHFGR